MAQPHADSSLLTPAVLEKLGRLEIIAQTVVEGHLTGRHRSPYQGSAIEFAQHREYVPGDDIRHLDWKVYARRDRYTIKQFEVETNLNTMLVVDGSQSMRAGEVSKYFTACCAAASLGFLLLRQQDAVGATVFDSELREVIPTRSHQANFREMLRVLESAKPEKKTDIGKVLRDVGARLTRRGLVAVFSDCFDDLDKLNAGLGNLRHNGHQVVLFHTLAAEELEFPYRGMTRFVGLEDTGQLLADPRSLRKAYLAAMEEFCVATRRACNAAGADYARITTKDPIDSVLAMWQARGGR
ncbi:MAG: DUF58 domain-containing protein [Planctomycetota bacterium]